MTKKKFKTWIGKDPGRRVQFIECPSCKQEVKLDPKNNKHEKWIMCPYCSYLFINKYFEGYVEVGYIG